MENSYEKGGAFRAFRLRPLPSQARGCPSELQGCHSSSGKDITTKQRPPVELARCCGVRRQTSIGGLFVCAFRGSSMRKRWDDVRPLGTPGVGNVSLRISRFSIDASKAADTQAMKTKTSTQECAYPTAFRCRSAHDGTPTEQKKMILTRSGRFHASTRCHSRR